VTSAGGLASAGLGLRREVVTPEGVPVRLELARAGDRAVAFVLDAFLMFLLTLAAAFLARLASGTGGAWVLAFWNLAFFLLRSFYFTFFELRWRGTTPGKRAVKIRVMDAAGGPLRADAVVVRNLMREVEFWAPLVVLIAPQVLWPDAPGWGRTVAGAWALVFLLMPLFNRDRLRVGDLVAGTRVVMAPRTSLLPDLGGQEVRRQEREATRCEFTERQLSVYGIYELQVLEELLRGREVQQREAMEAVARRIRKKIRWRGGDVHTERFLREFYAALRAHLERKMLLGKRKVDKHAKE
jgi:uncharacterized RDD family membrane protein YckC